MHCWFSRLSKSFISLIWTVIRLPNSVNLVALSMVFKFMREIVIQSLKKLCFRAVVTKIIVERFVCSTPMVYT